MYIAQSNERINGEKDMAFTKAWWERGISNKTAYQYELEFNKVKKAVLMDGEEARQMIDHNPMYWITDKARVISCGGWKGLRVLKQMPRGGKNIAKKHTTTGRTAMKNAVLLRVDGKSKTFSVHDLVSHYFPDKLAYTYLTGKGEKVTHHIDGYDMDNPYESNYPEHLEKLDNNGLHRFIHAQKAVPISTSEALKQMSKLSNLTKDDGNGTVMEAPNKNGKGGKIYELAEPITLDLKYVTNPQAFIEWYSDNFLDDGEQLVQLTWFLCKPGEDIDAVIEGLEFFGKTQKEFNDLERKPEGRERCY